MRIVAYILFAMGSCFCVLNFHRSFLRYPWFRFRGGNKDEFHFVSAVPFIGSAIVVGALLIPGSPPWLIVIGVLIAAIDTGGVHWCVGTLTFMWIRERLRNKPE